MSNVRHFDWVLFTVIFVLIAISVPVVLSAGVGKAISQHSAEATRGVLYDQGVRVIAALVFLFLGMIIPYRYLGNATIHLSWKKRTQESEPMNIPVAKILLWGTVLVLVLVLFMPKINNTHRWFSFAGVTFQPSEFARYVLIIFLAWRLTQKSEYDIGNFVWGFLPRLLPVMLIVGLIIIEPHLSVSLIILGLSFVMFFFARARLTHLGTIVTLLLLSSFVMYQQFDYIKDRIDTKFSNNPRVLKAGRYQIEQSLLAFGTGGFLSFKPGQSKQRDLFLPEAKGDFVYAIIGEEYGFVGTMFIVSLFLLLVYRGTRIALSTQDEFAKLLAIGIVTSLGIQAFVNMAVALDVSFLTGLPMPFISHGGTSLLVSSFAVGVVLNISAHAPKNNEANDDDEEEYSENEE
ncbi:MAG: FtsW/RodA/SpoVE family cell cycle protein [Ignavibacteriales bacterium]|nr:FtsW/RodA/SpoVE family cell cycle protein [Ignavibacteriales bacterium]